MKIQKSTIHEDKENVLLSYVSLCILSLYEIKIVEQA